MVRLYQFFIKRVLDVVFSLLLLPLALIICLPCSILIKLTDRGSVFYKSERLGVGMKPFKMYKLRTMVVNAPDIRNEDGSTFNALSDPRVTKVGAFLRKTSIDELPQLVNVLLGQMSFVGPRPSPLGNEHRYSNEFKSKFRIKPGITGLTQATLRNSATMEQRITNDIYYVNNISLHLDIKIIALTVMNVMTKKNINQD